MMNLRSAFRARAFALFALTIGGCAVVTDNGLRLGVGVGHSAEYLEKQGAKPATTGAPSELAQQARQWARGNSGDKGVIVVGETGVLRTLNAVERAEFYGAYLKAVQGEGAAESGARQAEFVAKIGGISRIETNKVPGIYSQDLPVAVRASDISQILFATALGSTVTGATGDLVVARNAGDGLLVIEQVLCREAAADYRSCAEQFPKGRFDRTTGAELGSDFEPKHGGTRINTVSYQRVPASVRTATQ
ncbi:MAG: hypothetical protein V4582_24605 [Pseudomonadota bacterium]